MALGQREHTRLCAAQRRQGRRYTESGADLLGQHTDVGALGAGHPDRVLILCGAAEVFNVIDRDGARRALNGLALAGSLVQRLAVDLDRTVHRRQLHPVTTELRQHGAQLLHADRDRGCFQRFAGNIAGIGAQSQAQRCFVGFIMVKLAVGGRSRLADKRREHTGGHRVQCARVSQLACAQCAAQLGQHIKAGPASGLIHGQNAVWRLHSRVPFLLLGFKRLPLRDGEPSPKVTGEGQVCR